MSFTYHEASTDPKRIAQMRQRETARAVPVRAALPIIGLRLGQGEQIAATAFLDIRNRPDITDLIRIHRMEGEGDVHTQWRFLLDARPQHYRQSLAILNITWSSPVSVEARIVFNIWEHRTFLDCAADTEVVFITGAKPKIPSPMAYASLGIPIRADELHYTLKAVRFVDAMLGGVR